MCCPFSARLTLFIKINIVESVFKGTDISLFVDVFVLRIRGSTLAGVEIAAQFCVHSVQKCTMESGFKFLSSKRVRVYFCQQVVPHPEPQILPDNTPIEVVKVAKFLGTNFGSHSP